MYDNCFYYMIMPYCAQLICFTNCSKLSAPVSSSESFRFAARQFPIVQVCDARDDAIVAEARLTKKDQHILEISIWLR